MNVMTALGIVTGSAYCDSRTCGECRFQDTGKCPTQGKSELKVAVQVLIEAFDIKLEEVNE